MSEGEHEPRTTRRGFAKQLAAFFAVGTGLALAGAQNAYAAGGYCICDDGSHGCGFGTKICFDNCNHTSCCKGPCPPPAFGTRENHTDCPCGG